MTESQDFFDTSLTIKMHAFKLDNASFIPIFAKFITH
jgi:hypothetical protein